MNIDLVRRSVEEAARRDPSFQQFGAKTHRYEFGPRVDEAAVAAVEAAHGFRFPADYRQFVIELGAGGAGPGYGVLPFGMIDDGFGHAPWSTWALAPGMPFPHRERWNDVSILERGKPHPDAFEDWDDYEAAVADWEDSDDALEARQDYWRAVGTTRGCIPLCHHGCALRDWLVVTGPEAGHVWHDASADVLGIEPVSRPDRVRSTFADWYLDWLSPPLES